tara:strand:+ start:186 stop:413 length:228 start_codon:yes stop_codon:yes gene_type:complete
MFYQFELWKRVGMPKNKGYGEKEAQYRGEAFDLQQNLPCRCIHCLSAEKTWPVFSDLKRIREMMERGALQSGPGK